MRCRCRAAAAVLLFLFSVSVPAAAMATAAASSLAATPAATLASTPASSPAPARAVSTGAYWVFFTDRGPTAPSPADWLAIAERIPADSWASRAVSPNGAVPDERDRPLWRGYVDQVAALGRIRHQTRWLNGVSVDLPVEAVEAVRAFPFVREVRAVARGEQQSLGPAFAPDGTPLERTLAEKNIATGPYPYGRSYGQLQEIQVPAVHALGYTGNRVRMMMLDTGFRKDHNAFSSARILGERDFVFHDGNTQDEPADLPGQESHGTGTWAVHGGYDPGHIVGPAYGADFVLAKTEDVRSETQVEEDNYVAALEWADSLGVRVTSASLSYTCFDNGFCYDYPLKDGDTPVISRAVDIAAARGILCVNAAGNYGSSPMSLGTPADADSILSVGAVDSLDLIASFSSRGPSDDGRRKPEVVARGVSTWWADFAAVDAYGSASGTSLSCPLVSGAAVLLAEAHPEWSNMQIRAALMNTADRRLSGGNDYGWGRINTLAALNSAPVLYPRPFSLVSPAQDALVTSPSPTFVWRHTVDGDGPVPVQFTLHLWQPVEGGPEWTLPAGADTTLALGFSLPENTLFKWEVFAEDQASHRRVSRETRTFQSPAAAGVRFPAAWTAVRLDLRVGPNPFAGEVQFAPVFSGAGAGRAENAGTTWSWAIYDPQGRRLAMARQPLSTDRGAVWDGTDMAGHEAPAGVYYLEVTSGPLTKRQIVVRMR
jgi:hypothetical protein